MVNVQKIGTSFRFFGVKQKGGRPVVGAIATFYDTVQGVVVAKGNLDSNGGWELVIPASSLTSGYHEIRFFGGGVVESMPNTDNRQRGSWESVLVVPFDVVDATALFVKGEPLVGDINGVNVDFQTVNKFVSGSLEVFHNGVSQDRGVHFVEIPDMNVRVGGAPMVGDVLTCNYQIKT